MRTAFVLALVWVVSGMGTARADDIEAYLPGGAWDDVYVSIAMDLGDAELDAALCTYGLDCGPPFTTAAAYQHLGEIYGEGEAVTAPGMFRAVLAAVLESPQFSLLNFSLLMSNHAENASGTAIGKRGGGTILRGFVRLREQRESLIATLLSVPALSGESAHAFQPKEMYFEWSRYLRGGNVALGENTSGNFGQSAPLPDYDAGTINGQAYLSPVAEGQRCARFYSLLFTLGTPAFDEDLNAEIAAELSLPLNTSFEQMLAHLHAPSTDLVPRSESREHLQKTWVVTSRDRPGDAARYANATGNRSVLYVNEPVELQVALSVALAEASAVASGSSAATFPADAFSPGRALDNLYLPLFQPRGTLSWPGNLKKLKLTGARSGDQTGTNVGESVYDAVVDAQLRPAMELVGEDAGKLKFDALTFWTDPATLPPGDGEFVPLGVDGRIVARGGAGQKIDGFVAYQAPGGEAVQYFIGDTNADPAVSGYTPRQVFFESGSAVQLSPLNVDAETVASLGPLLDPAAEYDDAERHVLIRWARGQDAKNGSTSAREWLLGALLHSQPLAVNYGATPGFSDANPNIRVLFGSGEGAFHILEDTDSRGDESGREVFAFYPQETLGNIAVQYEDVIPAAQMRYGVDGSPVALTVDRNGDGTLDYRSGDEVYVFFGLRRGGSSYYALDISDPDSVPTILWKISPTSGGPFDELGLSFSTPLVGRVNYSGTPMDVLVFAGGYDGGWNEGFTARRGKDAGAADDAVGNAIYIVNARTGELVWKAIRGTTGGRSNTHYQHAGLVDSVPSRVSALVTPEGNIHRLYVGDSGGAVWRVDLPPAQGTNPDHRRDNWFITKLADLGADEFEPAGSRADDRRFFHAPDTVQTFDDIGEFDGVLIQSGNRADPNETEVANYLFYLKDRETVSGSESVRARNDVASAPGKYQLADLADQTNCILGTEQLSSDGNSVPCAQLGLRNGWKIGFNAPGEKGLSKPLTDGGRVFASTFIPGEASSCSFRRGRGQLHVLRLADATAVANQSRHYDLGAGIPEAPASLGDVIFLPGSGIDLHDLDEDGERDKSKFIPSEADKLYRIYWREPGVDAL